MWPKQGVRSLLQRAKGNECEALSDLYTHVCTCGLREQALGSTYSVVRRSRESCTPAGLGIRLCFRYVCGSLAFEQPWAVSAPASSDQRAGGRASTPKAAWRSDGDA